MKRYLKKTAWLTLSSEHINSCSALLTVGLLSEIGKLLDSVIWSAPRGLPPWSLSKIDVKVLPVRYSCKERGRLWSSEEELSRFPPGKLDPWILEGVISAWDEKDKFLGLVYAEPNDLHSFLIGIQRANNTPFRSQKRKLGAPNFTSTNVANMLSISASWVQGGSTQLLWSVK